MLSIVSLPLSLVLTSVESAVTERTLVGSRDLRLVDDVRRSLRSFVVRSGRSGDGLHGGMWECRKRKRLCLCGWKEEGQSCRRRPIAKGSVGVKMRGDHGDMTSVVCFKGWGSGGCNR